MSEKINVNIIVAHCNGGGIGKDGNIPWKLPRDMIYFKGLTTDTYNDDGSIDDVFMLVSTDTIKETGAYDKDFFLQYEETDWCVRVRKAGYRIVYTPKAKIWHKGTLSSGGTHSPLNTFYNARNRTIFMKKNSTQIQWFNYITKLFFSIIPKRVINLIIKGNSNLLFSYLSGIISSLVWVINFNPKNERN